MPDEVSALNDLYKGLCIAMQEKLASGDATAQDLNVIRQFLRDNNITSIAIKGSPIANVVENFPFQDENDDNGGMHQKNLKLAK